MSRDSNFRAVEHVREQSFLDLLFPIFNDCNAGLAINSSIDNSTALSQLDDLFLIENEMLEEFEKLRTAIAKDITTVEGWLKQLEELKFETR